MEMGEETGQATRLLDSEAESDWAFTRQSGDEPEEAEGVL